MKSLFIAAGLLFSSLAFSQVIIGEGKSAVTNASVSLEFGTEKKGLVLPWVTSADAVTGAVNGTMVLDTTDKKVKIKLNSGWQELSPEATSIEGLSLQTGITDKETAKTSIGATTSDTPGILVLEDNNKAMLLPQVESPHLNIINPAAGMIVYDTKKGLVCVFNGTKWAFWKP